jgi:hypothetical protein
LAASGASACASLILANVSRLHQSGRLVAVLIAELVQDHAPHVPRA